MVPIVLSQYTCAQARVLMELVRECVLQRVCIRMFSHGCFNLAGRLAARLETNKQHGVDAPQLAV